MIIPVPPHKENEMIRRISDPVTVEYLQKPETQKLIDDMIETMRDKEGVGLAAPQIGIPIQLAVIETIPDYDEDGEPIEGTRDLYVIANPQLQWTSNKTSVAMEGCLSIPGYLGEVERPHSARVWALDRHGKRKRYKITGWDARIFQHEIDHLRGILYTDKLTSPDRYYTEEEWEKIVGEMEAEEESETEAAEKNKK